MCSGGRSFQPIRAAPVRSILDPWCAVPSTRFSPLRSHLILLRRDHAYVTLAGSMFSRAMTPVAVTSKVPSPPSTCTRNTRPKTPETPDQKQQQQRTASAEQRSEQQATTSDRDDNATASSMPIITPVRAALGNALRARTPTTARSLVQSPRDRSRRE